MTAQSNPSNSPTPLPPAGRPRRRWLAVSAVVLAAALTGAAATSAIGQYGPPWGGWHGPGFMRGPLSPADIEDRVDRGIRHAAIELDATPEQLEKLRAIAKGAVKDLLPMREKAMTARAKAAELLTAPKIDRSAIEAFRVEQMGLADAASKRFTQAVADAAEVLTPEQRLKAQALLQWRRSFFRRWHHG
jgi:periplasmic protein CpxP/Spy